LLNSLSEVLIVLAIFASFRLASDALERARELVPDVVASTRLEKGCIAYDVAEDVLSPGTFRVSELWESEADVRAHLAAPQMIEWGNVRAGMGITERKVKVFEIRDEITL
jgi:quinol monooxygenase YgiN